MIMKIIENIVSFKSVLYHLNLYFTKGWCDRYVLKLSQSECIIALNNVFDWLSFNIYLSYNSFVKYKFKW